MKQPVYRSIRQLLVVLILVALAAVLIIRTAGPAAHAATSDLFISEYIEGSSFNKAIEIYNGTGAAVNLATGNYVLQLYSNGSATATASLSLTGTIADGDVFVLANSGANAAILAQTDLQNNTVINFNGDDAVVLRKGGIAGTILDVIGQVGTDPGTEWGTGVTSTADNTITRKSTICVGDTNPSDAFDPATEWDGFAVDTSTNLGSHTASCGGVDTAPSVTATTPTNNQTNVAANSNITITFSEPVTVTGSWFQISCSSSGAHAAGQSGGPTTFTLDPTLDFTAGESCTLTVFAAQVTDQDGPADPMAANFTANFLIAGSCGAVFTPTYTIQGSGTASPIVGAVVATEGIVIGDFQTSTNLSGFYIQDPTGDANTATSDGVFVFDGAAPATNVAVGDRVRVTGTVAEAFNNTQVTASSVSVCSTGNSPPAATVYDLPEPVNNDLERVENMLVTFPETLTVTGNFTLGRFGELVLSSEGREFQQNNFDRPNSAAALAIASLNARRYIVLDDGKSTQNPDPTPYFDVNNTRRVGDTVTGLTGVLTFDFSEYRLQPTVAPSFVSANPRTASPDNVNGTVKISSFNVLNYFNGNGAGGGFPTSRGATSLAEFNRQRDKIIAAIIAINADIYGVIEIENDGNGAASAIQDLVNGLNAATAPGTYAFAEGTTPGTDEIKNSIIYKPGTVTAVGAAVNDTDAIWTGQARNPLAQTFSLNTNGAKLNFIVNHFTSKGCSANDTGLDADQGDGQGCDNLQRQLQADALLDFVEERQNVSGEARVLVMGDLNSYGEEDPIFRLEEDASDKLADGPGGLIDLNQRFVPAANRYSYQFGNNSGYLDHALATKEMNTYVSGTTVWHINADEPTVLDYNVEFKSGAQQAINVGTPYRSSDHDPVIVGINLLLPTATNGIISGAIRDGNGLPLDGAVVNLSGTQSRKTITDANGNYRFENVEATGFYTVRAARANYSISPQERSFSQIGNQTEAVFVATPSSITANPLDTAEYFVRQQYLDFLGREPDEAGFNYWSDQILSCGGNAACVDHKRVHVSAAFYFSIEFQSTGGLVDGLYRAGFDRAPSYSEFKPDAAQLASDVVVGRAGWERQLEVNRQAFLVAFVQRPAFQAAYGGLSNEQFVDTLLAHTGMIYGQSERDALVNGLANDSLTRAGVLGQIAGDQRFVAAKFNQTFVLTEYFGYLRRDADAEGYGYWLNKLNQFNGNFEQAEMVRAFIVAGEYRGRFPR